MDPRFVLEEFASADPQALLKPTDEHDFKSGKLGLQFTLLTLKYEGFEIKDPGTTRLFEDAPKRNPAVAMLDRLEHALGIVRTFNARNAVAADAAQDNITGVYRTHEAEFVEFARLKRIITSGVLNPTERAPN